MKMIHHFVTLLAIVGFSCPGVAEETPISLGTALTLAVDTPEKALKFLSVATSAYGVSVAAETTVTLKYPLAIKAASLTLETAAKIYKKTHTTIATKPATKLTLTTLSLATDGAVNLLNKETELADYILATGNKLASKILAKIEEIEAKNDSEIILALAKRLVSKINKYRKVTNTGYDLFGQAEADLIAGLNLISAAKSFKEPKEFEDLKVDLLDASITLAGSTQMFADYYIATVINDLIQSITQLKSDINAAIESIEKQPEAQNQST